MGFARGTPVWVFTFPIDSLLAFAVAYYLYSTGWIFLSVLALLVGGLFVLLLAFFRDPDRTISDGVCSPADGVVTEVKEVELPVRDIKGRGRYLFISIFMNVHNVHVNRSPIVGKVRTIRHIDGTFTFAFDKDSDNNERVIIALEGDRGMAYVVQIAGWFARRIVTYVSEGQNVDKGERIGMIRFGSRVDVYLPARRYEATVSEGEKVLAGATMIAREV